MGYQIQVNCTDSSCRNLVARCKYACKVIRKKKKCKQFELVEKI